MARECAADVASPDAGDRQFALWFWGRNVVGRLSRAGFEFIAVRAGRSQGGIEVVGVEGSVMVCISTEETSEDIGDGSSEAESWVWITLSRF